MWAFTVVVALGSCFGAAPGVKGHPLQPQNEMSEWYFAQPPITRSLLAAAFATTVACQAGAVSPHDLYFDWSLVLAGQAWRCATCFIFMGPAFDLGLLMRLYLLWSYSQRLEEGSFHGRTADFAWFVALGAGFLLALAAIPGWLDLHFMAESLSFMFIQVWARRNEAARMVIMGVLEVRAPYLPWVLMMFSISMGAEAGEAFAGIVAGHTYYFLEDVMPIVNAAKGRGRKRVLQTPEMMYWLCGSGDEDDRQFQ